MTVAAPARARLAATLLQGFAAAGGAIVFLLAIAGLANAWLSRAPLPDAFRSAAVVAHVSTVLIALPLGISQILLPKGTLRHRTVGYVWVGLMIATALVSFAIHRINPHGLSATHLLSVMTLVFAPLVVVFARAGRVSAHVSVVLGPMLGGLVVAGLLTFSPGRALGQLLSRLFGHGV